MVPGGGQMKKTFWRPDLQVITLADEDRYFDMHFQYTCARAYYVQLRHIRCSSSPRGKKNGFLNVSLGFST